MQCDRISAWDVFFTYEDDIYTVKNSGISSCNSTLYIREGFKYTSLTNALVDGVFELEDILDYDWDFNIYKANFPLNDIDIESIVMTDEVGINEDYVIDDSNVILSIKEDMYFYCSGFVSEFDYSEDDVISIITINDVEGLTYTFLLRDSGTVYLDEDMYSDNQNRFNYIYNEVFN